VTTLQFPKDCENPIPLGQFFLLSYVTHQKSINFNPEYGDHCVLTASPVSFLHSGSINKGLKTWWIVLNTKALSKTQFQKKIIYF
jgi:hypothetical protein